MNHVPIFINQDIIPRNGDELCLFDHKEINALLKTDAFPKGVVVKAYDRNDKVDLISDTWVCFLHFPFTIGMTYPFPPLVDEFFKVTGLCYSQAMPMVWRVLRSLCVLNECRGLGLGLPEMAACYQLRTHGFSRFVLQSRNSSRQMIPWLTHNDNDWKRRFFFVKRSSIPGGDKLPKNWVLKAPKFEVLSPTSSDTPDKLALLFQIPNRERACQFELTPSEASFSSEHTPSMLSVPQSSTKFSLADLKLKMVKKEKIAGTPASKPIHIPATRSAKRKKSSDSVINLESFDGLSASDTKDRMLLGVNHLYQLIKDQEDELLESKEKYLELKKTAAEEVEALGKEATEVAKRVEEEKRLMAEEAQSSAAASVVEAMYDMAKEASAAGFSLPSWDVRSWAEMLGRTEDEGLAAKEAEGKPGAGGNGGGDGASMGDEGVMTA